MVGMKKMKQIKVSVTEEEYARMAVQAEGEGMFLAGWARRVLVMRLKDPEDMGLEMERIAERRVEREEPYVPPNADIPEELPQKPLTRKAEIEEARRKRQEYWDTRGLVPPEEGQSDIESMDP